ncbi:MAG: Na+/H+ antiporter NhaA [Deltaproteobacteria bacterium]|nr:Na+/H+ antiporter NhaA [Deltaproteobacteria bacterium]
MLNNIKLSPTTLVADYIVRPAESFFRQEASSSVLLLLASLIAVAWANSSFAPAYHHLLHTNLTLALGEIRITKSLVHWINDGLMTFFIFVVGLEIKREILVGELSSPKSALLPVVAALGGMLFPGAIYFLLNRGTGTANGWGIPMATDIAFALGAIAVFGRKLPVGLRVFLSAFAIADDLGAVMIIAFFYTKEIVWSYLIVCIFFVFGLAVANFLWIRSTLLYALLGLGVWIAVLGSGVHPTVAGFVVAMFIPARGKYDTDQFVKKVREIMDEFQCEEQSCGYSILLDQGHLSAVHALELACHDVETPLQRMEHSLHPWIAFGLLPVFAFANAGLSLEGVNLTSIFAHPATIGIALGLLIGKPVGITLFSFLAVKTNIAVLPTGVRWSHIIGAGMLGGIGFTMSLFVSNLSFFSAELLNYSKLGILLGSILSAIAGLLFLTGNYSLQSRREAASSA